MEMLMVVINENLLVYVRKKKTINWNVVYFQLNNCAIDTSMKVAERCNI